jgi:hypothetical protein
VSQITNTAWGTYNPAIEKNYSRTKADQPFAEAFPYSRSYEYNNEGLPVKIIDGPWIITLEYK